jgi:hypothetical protein
MLGCAVLIAPPPGVGTFEFVVLAGLRTAQLVRGCSPRVDGCHKKTTTAQMEIAAGKVTGSLFTQPKAVPEEALVRV